MFFVLSSTTIINDSAGLLLMISHVIRYFWRIIRGPFKMEAQGTLARTGPDQHSNSVLVLSER